MDGVLHDTTRESVNAIADTNPAFSGCCPAPRAQFLFIIGSLNAVSALIFQVYDVLEHLDTGTVCFSCDPIEKNMFNWRSGCRAPTPHDGQHPERRLPRPTPLLYSELPHPYEPLDCDVSFFRWHSFSLKWFWNNMYRSGVTDMHFSLPPRWKIKNATFSQY